MNPYQYVAASGSALRVKHKIVSKSLNHNAVDNARKNNRANELNKEVPCLGKKRASKSL